MDQLHPLMDAQIVDLFPLLKLFQGNLEAEEEINRQSLLSIKMKTCDSNTNRNAWNQLTGKIKYNVTKEKKKIRKQSLKQKL